MATATRAFDDLLREASSREELTPLLEALGFEPLGDEVPREAWPAYGLGEAAGVAALVVAGRAGTLDALLLELGGAGEADPLRLAGAIRGRNTTRLHLFVFADDGYRRLTFATFGPGDEPRHLAVDRGDVRDSDLEALEEMAARPGEDGLQLSLRQRTALDRTRVTRRFFADFRAHRNAVAAAWTGIPGDAERERRQLALLFLSRLTFLCFLQRRGALAGDERYLPGLLAPPVRGGPAVGGHAGVAGDTVYRRRLVPLFFGALNRRPDERTPEALALGDLPYLNGGLFEPHALERRYPELDLADAVVASAVLGLLERYRFSARESGDGGGYGIDPEVLGRVFEGLMEADRRERTGTYYTPAPVVHRVVREGLAVYLGGACPGVDVDGLLAGYAEPGPPGAGERAIPQPGEARYRVRRALERVRVLDPACGSGAFLLGALHHLSRILGAVSDQPSGTVRREIVARSLHGVDLLDDAALLCSLRLWLALSGDEREVRPLPNLDRRIRQGDALVDPLDITLLQLDGDAAGIRLDPLRDPDLRRAARSVAPAARRYLDSDPDSREAARRDLARIEHELAARWVRRISELESRRRRHLAAAAADRDLFGEPTAASIRAARALQRADQHRGELDRVARALDVDGAVPFFSFGVHFAEADAGFDLIVSNPPWVRAHRWPARLRRLATRSYEVCRAPGWQAGTGITGAVAGAGAQVDLALLFVERSLRLLAPGGVLAMLVPAKAMRALYGGAARRILLRDLELALIEDHALDQRSIFRADAFAAVLVGRRRPPGDSRTTRPVDGGGPGTRIRMVRRGVPPLQFAVTAEDLPLFPDDPASPWLLAPPDVVGVLRAMQDAGPPLGRHPGLRARRGVMTGANGELLLARVEPKLGGLARIEAEGYRARRRSGDLARAAGRYRAWVETAGVRPVVRGADIDAFHYRTERYVVWCHDQEGRPRPPGPRLGRYLARHRHVLEGRPDWKPGLPLGCVFRLSRATLAPRVAWHDLSDTLRAVALPARVPFDGRTVELVPLNTVYFIPVDRPRDALLLAGLLNSLPVRTFARAIAERAKDARFRFFAWTVACLPLPPGWRDGAAATEVSAISARAHQRGGVSPEDQARLDRAVAALYGMGDTALEPIRRFDAWLRGVA